MSLPTQPVNDGGRRILVVDDSASARRMLAVLLGSVGFACTEAADGGEAFDLHLRHSYDLVVTDLEMPEVDGYELLAAFSLMPPWRRPPVIVLSGAAEEARHKRSRELRMASAVLPKPIEVKALLRAVADALGGQAALQRDRA